MKIWRIENEETMVGMWYDKNGVPTNYIHSIDGISKDLPMDKDVEHYRQQGKEWYSGCSRKEDMFHWFSKDDITALNQDGYKLYEFEADEFIEEEFQTIFTRESMHDKKVIPYTDIWTDWKK